MSLPDGIIRRITKAMQRERIAKQIDEYIARGGRITYVPTGCQTENMVNFSKQELINHHKQKTRRIRNSKSKEDYNAHRRYVRSIKKDSNRGSE